MSLINSTAIPSGATGYEIDQSLRFNDNDSANLKRIFTATGNRKIWTFSTWTKRGLLGAQMSIFGCYQANDSPLRLKFDASDKLTVDNWAGAMVATTEVYRDTSAWYHIILALDTTQSTASNRAKIYVNGVQQATVAGGAGYPSLNLESVVNLTGQDHRIGTLLPYDPSQYYDGYLGEVNFVDGQALTPSDFGETGDYGEWKPIEYSGSYGTNGFYLPFKQDYSVEGFSTVTYAGDGVAGTYVGGVGFQSDMTWVKSRTGAENHSLYDAVRGGGKTLYPNLTAVENSSNLLTFTTDGFTQNTDNNNASANNYVAWNWDMGGSNASNTEGSITSTVRANATYGQSIVSFTGNATAGATVGHGLSSAPEMIILKDRDGTTNWSVYHASNTAAPETEALALNTTDATSDYLWWNDTAPTNSLFSLGAISNTNANGNDFIAYCFHSVTGYSKFGSYSGTGSSGNAITGVGFMPAFLLVKRTDNAQSWRIYDNTRDTNNPRNKLLFPSDSSAEATSSTYDVDFDSDGFTLDGTNAASNGSGGTYIYMAFADKREYAYWLDQSGNNNDWTSNNLTESDVMVDSPTNNFATLNPLEGTRSTTGTRTYSEGNLQLLTPQGQNGNTFSTIGVTSGKWYAEFLYKATNGLHRATVGVTGDRIATLNGGNIGSLSGARDVGYMGNDGDKFVSGSESSYGAAFSVGDIIGVALDLDNNTVNFSNNNTFKGTISIASSGTWHIGCGDVSGGATATHVVNYGQDSSFAANKTAQGNTDGNNIGDFYYAPPSGFLALCTSNLPDVAVIPSEHFNTVLYSGNSTANRSVSGVGFSPSFSWIKKRSEAGGHVLYDTVRGATKQLVTNSTAAEVTNYSTGYLTSFDSDGFTTTGGSDSTDPYYIINESGHTYAAWNWKANGSGSSNTNGSITSTVSANVDAGFSIVSYTGAGSAATLGHGLSKAPEMYIVKDRDTGLTHWWTYHIGNTSQPETDALRLDGNNVTSDDSTFFNDTAPTSLVFSVGSYSELSGNGKKYITYCFHSVDGYSKVGSYTGNGSADGTFVYTGFRPAYVMIKRSDDTGHWKVYTSVISPENLVNDYFNANEPDALGSPATANSLDFLSNGFKVKSDYGDTNTGTLIYIAFAEQPFKYSNAR